MAPYEIQCRGIAFEFRLSWSPRRAIIRRNSSGNRNSISRRPSLPWRGWARVTSTHESRVRAISVGNADRFRSNESTTGAGGPVRRCPCLPTPSNVRSNRRPQSMSLVSRICRIWSPISFRGIRRHFIARRRRHFFALLRSCLARFRICGRATQSHDSLVDPLTNDPELAHGRGHVVSELPSLQTPCGYRGTSCGPPTPPTRPTLLAWPAARASATRGADFPCPRISTSTRRATPSRKSIFVRKTCPGVAHPAGSGGPPSHRPIRPQPRSIRRARGCDSYPMGPGGHPRSNSRRESTARNLPMGVQEGLPFLERNDVGFDVF